MRVSTENFNQNYSCDVSQEVSSSKLFESTIAECSRGTSVNSEGPGRLEPDSIDCTDPFEGAVSNYERTAASARAAVENLAERRIVDLELLEKFKTDLGRFDERARSLNLGDRECARFYSALENLLVEDENCPVLHEHRRTLCLQVLSQAADPTTIDQGMHQTCSVAAIESRLYSRCPSEAASLVAQVATTGRYHGPQGYSVDVPDCFLAPDSEAKHYAEHGQARSFASQVFQGAVINFAYQSGAQSYLYGTDKMGGDPTKLRYIQSTQTLLSTGEILVDDSLGYAVAGEPGLSVRDIQRLNKLMLRELDDDSFLLLASVFEENSVRRIESEEDLNDALASAAARGKLPVIVGINSYNEPFWGDSSYGAAGGAGSWHAVTVRSYAPGDPPMVEVDNQWGEKADKLGDAGISVRSLFLAMHNPGDARLLQEMTGDADALAALGQLDVPQRLDILRLRRCIPENTTGHLSDEELISAITAEIEKCRRRFASEASDESQSSQTPEAALKERIARQIEALSFFVPLDRKIDMLKRANEAGLLSDISYELSLADYTEEVRAQLATEARPVETTRSASTLDRETAERRLAYLREGLDEERLARVDSFIRLD